MACATTPDVALQEIALGIDECVSAVDRFAVDAVGMGAGRDDLFRPEAVPPHTTSPMRPPAMP